MSGLAWVIVVVLVLVFMVALVLGLCKTAKGN